MKKDKINLILSWVLFVVAIYLIPIYDLISLLILIIIPRFRKIENEKILGREFLEENIDATKMAKLVSLIIALVVLIYTLYKVFNYHGVLCRSAWYLDNNVYSFASFYYVSQI